MENSKLIQLLKTFDTRELREFKEFMESPLFNKNQDLTDFYLYLKKIAPAFLAKKLNKNVVYRQLYGAKKYNDKQMRYLMSFTLKLAEQFIGWKKYQEQEILIKSHTLESLVERNLEKNYQNIFQNAEKELNEKPLRNARYYQDKYLLTEVSNKHFTAKNLRKFNDKLQEVANYFDVYYLSQKLKYSCEMMSMQRFLSADYSQNLIEEIGRFLRKSSYENVPAIALYHQVFLTLTDENNEAHFEQLTALMDEHIDCFSDEEMQEFYFHTINYCIRKMRQKEEKYVEKALQIYIKGVENKLLLHNDLISPWDYKNIVKLGLRLKKFAWTEQFIKKYTDILAEEYRLNAFNYSLADLSYHKQEIPTALTHLREVEFTDIFFTLDAKIMLLKIYYDNEEEEALLSLLTSFKIFLKRNKLISVEVKNTYENFINLLSQILKSKKEHITDLQQKINDTPLLTDRNWLLEVIQKLT